MNNKFKYILIFFSLILLILALIFFTKKDSKPIKTNPKPAVVAESDLPQIVATKPSPLEDNIVSASEIIEITFNKPLQNSGEFKLRIEPKIEVKIELSSDRKTAKIIPLTPFVLGQTYTIFIGPDTKFDGIQNWGQEKIYHFKTVKYTGV